MVTSSVDPLLHMTPTFNLPALEVCRASGEDLMALVVCYLLFLTGSYLSGHQRHPPPPHHPPQKENSNGPAVPNERDGEPLSCASFTSDKPWSTFPLSSSQPDLPRPLRPEHGYRRGTNVSFLVPFVEQDEVFSHLEGAAGVGSFFYSACDHIFGLAARFEA